jgi:hypothetical protein
MGCADWWHGEGSIDLKLQGVSHACRTRGSDGLLLAQEVAEVGNCVLRIADELALGLPAVELFALDVGQGGGDLAVLGALALARSPERTWEKRRTSVFVGNDLCLALARRVGNGAVRVAEGYAYRDPLSGVCLRTHLARGRSW